MPAANWPSAEGEREDPDSHTSKIPLVGKTSLTPCSALPHLEVGGIGLDRKAQCDEKHYSNCRAPASEDLPVNDKQQSVSACILSAVIYRRTHLPQHRESSVCPQPALQNVPPSLEHISRKKIDTHLCCFNLKSQAPLPLQLHIRPFPHLRM